MFIGKHFGKRKPQWNFFITNYENFKYSESSKLFKLILFGFIFQIVLFSPIVYWIFQNYAIIESFLPQHLNLSENIQFEKKWIVFLIAIMTAVQAAWSYFIWKSMLTTQSPMSLIKPSLVTTASPDEAAAQRHAS